MSVEKYTPEEVLLHSFDAFGSRTITLFQFIHYALAANYEAERARFILAVLENMGIVRFYAGKNKQQDEFFITLIPPEKIQ